MTVDAFDTARADHIYRVGPETLVAQSFAVATGPVARYARQTVEMSQPGPDGFALRWVVSGRVEQPELIKGRLPEDQASASVPFVRPEQSAMLPPPQPVAAWERDLGELGPKDQVLLFFQGSPTQPTLRVLPSREPATGLAATVRRAAAIQAMADPSQRQAAWLEQLLSAASDELRQAALRSLIADSSVDWVQFERVLSTVLSRPTLSVRERAYAAGIVAWAVMQGRWGAHQVAAVDLVCRQFDLARHPDLQLQLVLTLKQLMAFGAAEPDDPVHTHIRQRVAQSLRRAAADAPTPDVEQQLQQIRRAHPEAI